MKRVSSYLIMLALACGGPGLIASAAAAAYTVQSVTLEQQERSAQIRVIGNDEPTYTIYQLFAPDRLVIDIADASLAERFNAPDQLSPGPLRQLRARQLADQEPAMVRLELLLSGGGAEYEAERRKNDIVVTLRQAASQVPPTPQAAALKSKQRPANAAAMLADLKKQPPPNGITELIQPQIPSLSEQPSSSPKKTEPAAETLSAPTAGQATTPAVPAVFDDFGFGGYSGARISIDYFKTDLHNVFRLFGEISNRNIVVDEAVQGTLTLSLDQVPWDFALDIIINLKDLQKEERFNTIVISPADKQFTWKAEAGDTGLSIRTDGDLARREGLAVQQRLEIPQEQLRAQELIRQANVHRQRGEHSRAAAVYQQALQLWPDNSRLAEQLAVVSLAQLGNNARAANFARQAWRHDRENHRAALLAAVALANMQRTEEAKEFFDHAINRPQPDSEALVSYAAFAEEHDSPHGALALLARHQELYGDTLETMLARARLLDKVGASQKASREYQALLYSGYDLPEDLSRYIVERTTVHGE